MKAILFLLLFFLAPVAYAQVALDGAGAINLDTNRRWMQATNLHIHDFCGDGTQTGPLYGLVVDNETCEWDGVTSCTPGGSDNYLCMPTMAVIADHAVQTGIPFSIDGAKFGICVGGSAAGDFCESDTPCTGEGTCTTSSMESPISVQFGGAASLVNRITVLKEYQTAYSAAGGTGSAPFEGGGRPDIVAAINNLSSCTGACADEIMGTATFDTPWDASMLRTVSTSRFMEIFDALTGKTRGGFGSWSNRSTVWFQEQADALAVAAGEGPESCCHDPGHVTGTALDTGASCNGTEGYGCPILYGIVSDGDGDWAGTRNDQILGVSALLPDLENPDFQDFMVEYILRYLKDLEDNGVDVDAVVLSRLTGKPQWNSTIDDATYAATDPKYACSKLADNLMQTWRGSRSSTDPIELGDAFGLYCADNPGAIGTHAGGTPCTEKADCLSLGACVADVCEDDAGVGCTSDADCFRPCVNDCTPIGPILEPNWLAAGVAKGKSNSWIVAMESFYTKLCAGLNLGLDGIEGGGDDRDFASFYTSDAHQTVHDYDSDWVPLSVRKLRSSEGVLCYAGSVAASSAPFNPTKIPVPKGWTARTPS